MAKTRTQIHNELIDREAIRDCLTRYARAIDRVDEEELDSVFWEDAKDDHVMFQGNIKDFKTFFLPMLNSLDQTSHLVGNFLIEISGLQAHVESYFLAFSRTPEINGTPHDSYVGGRYLDRMECRGDEWRIAERVMVVDWFRDMEDSADWSNGFKGFETMPGGHKPKDRSYKLFEKHLI